MISVGLSTYEQRQVERIGKWKGWRPGPVKQVANRLKRPLDWMAKRAMSGERLTKLLETLNASADWSIPLNLIRREAGVADVRELRKGSLERCDELEQHVKRVGMVEITTESLLGGVGGLATELASIPVELMMMLRTVYRVARCYGYDLDAEMHKTVVLAVIGVSMVKDPDQRRIWCGKIWEMIHRVESDGDLTEEEKLLNEEFRDEVIEEVMQGVAIELLENKVEESVPLLGEVLGVVLDNAFIYRIEKAARCVFQELWLRENGRVEAIEPMFNHFDVGARVGEGLYQAVYGAAYGIGFGIAVPTILVSRVGAAVLPEIVVDGLRAGGADAEERVERVLAEGKGVGEVTG
jgi:hypothetical protein